MAMKYNDSTGEWEEQDETVGASMSQPTGSVPTPNMSLSSVFNQQQPSFSFDGGDWVKQDQSGNVAFRDAAGTWNPLGRGEHAESWGYTGKAVDDPMVDKLFAYKASNPNGLNTEQQAFFNNPIVGLDSFGQGQRWGNLDLFDNKFNPQQAGALMQTGGNNFLSAADRNAGGAFNFEQSAAEQSKRAGSDGFLGMGDMGTALALAAAIYGGGSLAGLWGEVGAGAMAGAGAAADAGSIASQWAALEGTPTLTMGGELAAGGAGAFAAADGFAGLPEVLGNAGGYGFSSSEVLGGQPEFLGGGGDVGSILDMVSSSANSFNPALNPTAAGNIESGLSYLSGGEPPLPLNNYEAYTPDFGTMADAEYAANVGAGQEIPEGFGMEGIGSTPAMDTLGSTNRLQSYLNTIKGGGMNMWDALTTPIGGGQRKLFGAPTPLGMAGRGLSALFDMGSNKEAMGIMQRQFDAANNWTDPNRARADEANRMWLQNFQDPKAGYDEFMTGAGREFTDQARAQAAKSGSRGRYLNSGKMQSDLASLFMKNQLSRGDSLSRGFANGQNNYAASASAAPVTLIWFVISMHQ